MKDITKLLVASILGGTITAGLIIGWDVIADGLQQNDQVPRLISYHGTLEKDGAGVNATVEMTFSIYDGANAADPSWTEVQTVPVYSGAFSVLLGSTGQGSVSSLDATIKSADDLYMGVAVKEGDAWVTLSNRQRFTPLPYAIWTTAATNLTANTIDGLQNGGELFLNFHTQANVTTGSNLLVGEHLYTAGGASLDGGDLHVYGPNIWFKEHPDRGDGGAALVHGTGDQLVLNWENQLSGGTQVSSDLHVTGHYSGTYLPCRAGNCGASDIDLPGGNTQSGWWNDWGLCPAGTYMCGMALRAEAWCGGDCDDTGVDDIAIRCCPF